MCAGQLYLHTNLLYLISLSNDALGWSLYTVEFKKVISKELQVCERKQKLCNQMSPTPMVQHPPVGQVLLIMEASQSHSDTPHSVGLLWMRDEPDAETLTDNTQRSQETAIHAPGWIRSQNPSKRAAAVSRFRRRGHRDRHII